MLLKAANLIALYQNHNTYKRVKNDLAINLGARDRIKIN
jgi:hypothetical protein